MDLTWLHYSIVDVRQNVLPLQEGTKVDGHLFRPPILSLSNLQANKNNYKMSHNQPLNPNASNQVMYNMLNFLNSEVAAYDGYTADLEAEVRTARWRASAFEERANLYRQELDELWLREASRQAGTETVVAALDNMYNLYLAMARECPAIGRFHEQLQRIILAAESGRRMTSPVIDLTTESEPEEDTEDDLSNFIEERDADAALEQLVEASAAQYVRTANGYDEVIDLTEE